MERTLYAMVLDPAVPDPMTAWRGAYARLQRAGCAHCGRAAATRRCGRCRTALFCDAACQRAAWPDHKRRCAPPPS